MRVFGLNVTTSVIEDSAEENKAAAIYEAMGRPYMHPVMVKTIEQQDLQAIHRVRDEINSHRIAKVNQIRGLVTEYRLVTPKQLPALSRAIPDWLEDAETVSASYSGCFFKGYGETYLHWFRE